jgi:hypothetical protein
MSRASVPFLPGRPPPSPPCCAAWRRPGSLGATPRTGVCRVRRTVAPTPAYPASRTVMAEPGPEPHFPGARDQPSAISGTRRHSRLKLSGNPHNGPSTVTHCNRRVAAASHRIGHRPERHDRPGYRTLRRADTCIFSTRGLRWSTHLALALEAIGAVVSGDPAYDEAGSGLASDSSIMGTTAPQNRAISSGRLSAQDAIDSNGSTSAKVTARRWRIRVRVARFAVPRVCVVRASCRMTSWSAHARC